MIIANNGHSLKITGDGSQIISSLDDGISTSGSVTTIADTTKNWVVNMWANYIVRVVINGITYFRTISSNTTDTLTVATLPAGTAEIDTLTMTTGVTTDGNITVTLDGVDVEIAVLGGEIEVDTLTITGADTSAGDVTVTLNGVGVAIAIAESDSITTIATKVRAGTYSGWVAGGTAESAVITFTKAAKGACSAPTFGVASTGVTGTIVVTNAGVTADTPTTAAGKIRGGTFTGWTVTGETTGAIFTSDTNEVRATPTIDFADTLAEGTFVVDPAGVDPIPVTAGLEYQIKPKL